jgi:hypothetical protein
MGSDPLCRYNISKLLDLLIVRHLAPMLNSSGVVLNAVNPGFCYSGLTKEVRNIGLRVGERLLARTTEEGGRMLVIAAGWGEESHGEYLSDGGLKSYEPLCFPYGIMLTEVQGVIVCFK